MNDDKEIKSISPIIPVNVENPNFDQQKLEQNSASNQNIGHAPIKISSNIENSHNNVQTANQRIGTRHKWDEWTPKEVYKIKII